MENTKIDQIDRAILNALQIDGRLSMIELSEKVGLSPTPCSRRVKKLEDGGAITGYHAQIDEAKIGFGFSVFVSIQLERQLEDAMRSFEKAIAEYPEVVNCWLMTGNRDYLMRIAIPDLKGFELFLTSKLTKVSGIASIESSIPVRQVKSNTSRGLM